MQEVTTHTGGRSQWPCSAKCKPDCCSSSGSDSVKQDQQLLPPALPVVCYHKCAIYQFLGGWMQVIQSKMRPAVPNKWSGSLLCGHKLL